MSPLLADPLTIKELSGLSRRWQTYLARGIYVGLIGLILYEFWPTAIRDRDLPSVSELADLSRRLFHDFVWLQMAFVTLTAIIAASETIPREFERGMLGLLTLTPLTPREIIAGKWKAVMAQSGSLLLCGAPVVAICVYLGGIGVWELCWSLSLTAATASGAAATALRRSAGQGTAMGATFVTAFWIGLWTLGATIVDATFGDTLASCLHPLYAAHGASRISFGGPQIGWIATSILCLLWTWLCLREAATRLDTRIAEEGHAFAPESIAAGKDRFTQLLFLQGYRQFGPGGVWEEQPLLWKELTTRAASRGVHYWRTPVIMFCVMMALPVVINCGGSDRGFLYGLGAVLAILAVLNGASLFAPEKASRRLETLMMTPILGRDIVGTKLLAGVIAPETLAIAGSGLFTVVGWTWRSGLETAALFLWIGGLFLTFTYVLAAAASLQARTVRAASVFSFAVLSILLVLSWYLPSEVALFLQPASLIEYSVCSNREHWGLPLSYPPASLKELMLYSAIYGSAIVLLVFWMVRRFDRIVGRSG